MAKGKVLFEVEFEGLELMMQKMEALIRESGDAMGSGSRVSGETIMTDIKASRPGAGVPRKDGILAGSGRVAGPDKEGAVELSFGGAAAPYALRQHEELAWRHKLGEARYLVRGVERFVADGAPDVALKRVMDLTIENAKRQT